jgi:hypothetical protein
LLSNQFVISSQTLGKIKKLYPKHERHLICIDNMYRVVLGSGMGLSHSGSVSEASFLTKVEHKLVSNGRMHAYHVEHFFRFKDDILLLLGGDRIKWRDFFATMKLYASPFELTCTAISKHSVDFLELSISSVNGSIVFRPRDKVTKLPVPPLAMDSAHHPRTLRTWQVAYTDRRCSLCSLKEDKRVEISRAISMFSEQGFPASIIDKLRHLVNIHILGCPRPKKSPSNSRCIWLVVPYMPCFEIDKFEYKLKAFLALPWVKCALDFHSISVEVRTSWRNGSKNLSNVIRSHSISGGK